MGFYPKFSKSEHNPDRRKSRKIGQKKKNRTIINKNPENLNFLGLITGVGKKLSKWDPDKRGQRNTSRNYVLEPNGLLRLIWWGNFFSIFFSYF